MTISRIGLPRIYQQLPRILPFCLRTSLVHRAFSTSPQSERTDQDRQRTFKWKSFVGGLLAGSCMTGVAVYAMNQKKENDKIHSYIKSMQENMATLGPLGDRTKGQVEYTLDPNMADAAHALSLRTVEEATGQFFIDEALLRETGIADFSHYAVDPTQPLIQTLFLPLKEGMVPISRELFLK
jgi:hypothetical protein